jgi:hypothetical protein
MLILVPLGPTRRGITEKVFGRVELTFAEHAQVAGIPVAEALDPRDKNPVQFGNVSGLCES